MPKHMMDAHETGVYIGGTLKPLSYWTVLDMAKKGKLPHVKCGNRVLFSAEAIDSWIEEQEAKSINKPNPDTQYGKLRKIQG